MKTKTKHSHHHDHKSDRRHEHHDKPKFDLEKREVRVGARLYRWEELHCGGEEWQRVSRNWIRLNGKKVPFVKASKRAKCDGDGMPHDWEEIIHRVSRRTLDELSHLLSGEKRTAQRQLQKDVLMVERASLGLSYSDEESASDEEKLTPWQKHNQPQASGEIKRDKYGIKIYSLPEKKFYLQVTVNNSTKYPGSASVRFFIGGRPWMYTFDVEAMEALRREFARAGLPKGS